MEKTVYNYASRKAKLIATVLFIVGAVMAFASMVTTYSGSKLFSFLLLVVGCVLSCIALNKTELTLPAIIVVAVAILWRLSSDFTLLSSFVDYNRLGRRGSRANFGGLITAIVVILALLQAAAWVLVAIGHGKFSQGIRKNKLIFIGILAAGIDVLAAFIVEFAVGIAGQARGTFIIACSFDLVALLGFVAGYFLLSRSELEASVVIVPVATADGNANLQQLRPIHIVWSIVLDIITFGIYGWVWFWRNAKRVRQVCGESTRGCGDEVLLYIFGGVFYRMYWYYTRSKQVNTAVKEMGYDGIFLSPALYLLLAVFTPKIFQYSFLSANFNKLYFRACVEGDVQPEVTPEAKRYLSKRHGLLKVVLLGIITFGIYFLVTQIRIGNRVKLMQGKQGVRVGQLIAMWLIPIYWLYWMISRRKKYHEGSNEATLEAWMLLAIPFYPIYWLVSRTNELRVGAKQFGVTVAEESVWTLLFAIFMPVLCYANMLININRVADTIVANNAAEAAAAKETAALAEQAAPAEEAAPSEEE